MSTLTKKTSPTGSAQRVDDLVASVITDVTTKKTNPKDAIGVRKAPLSVVSAPVMAEVGVGMLEGALKYGRHNYRCTGVRASVYYDAAMRHLNLYWEGEDIDPDSGLPHVIKAICTLVVLRDAMIHDKYDDDRPPKTPKGWMDDINAKVEALLERYPDPEEPVTELNKLDWQPRTPQT